MTIYNYQHGIEEYIRVIDTRINNNVMLTITELLTPLVVWDAYTQPLAKKGLIFHKKTLENFVRKKNLLEKFCEREREKVREKKDSTRAPPSSQLIEKQRVTRRGIGQRKRYR